MLVLILRTLLIYLLIIFAMRLMGKRQLGELQPSELVSTILISNLASISIESPELPLSASLIPVFLIVATELIMSAICFKHPKVSHLISGSPVAVIKDGIIDQQTLQDLRFSTGDLLEALRGKGIFDPSKVDYALIETNGSISVYQLTSASQNKPYIPFVIDGHLLIENIKWCHKDTHWVMLRLNENNCSLKNTLLLLGCDGEAYHFVKKENSPEDKTSRLF